MSRTYVYRASSSRGQKKHVSFIPAKATSFLHAANNSPKSIFYSS